MNLVWYDHTFHELTAAQLYAIVRLRERVFIVEQNCVYLDADNIDPHCRHVWAEHDSTIVAYMRVVPAGIKYPEPSLGRIITAPEARGTGLGRILVERGLAMLAPQPIKIQAQAYLEAFYTSLGFARLTEPYLEDGIPHLDMLRPASS